MSLNIEHREETERKKRRRRKKETSECKRRHFKQEGWDRYHFDQFLVVSVELDGVERRTKGDRYEEESGAVRREARLAEERFVEGVGLKAVGAKERGREIRQEREREAESRDGYI